MNRGVAIAGNTLYMVTIDAHLVAVNARDGKQLWDHEVAKASAGYAMTHAPLVIKDKVIAGVAGAEFGIRGFIAAFKAENGALAWRRWTVPRAGEPGIAGMADNQSLQRQRTNACLQKKGWRYIEDE